VTNLEYALFQIDSLREYEWNPMNYNPGGRSTLCWRAISRPWTSAWKTSAAG